MKLINSIVEQIVKPPREDYSLIHLALHQSNSQYSTSTTNNMSSRIDFTLPNHRNQLLAASLFIPHLPSSKYIIYLHGSSSCRLQVLHYLSNILKEGFNLCAFDFSGSGISEGQHTTAGYQQAEDIGTMVSWLIKRGAEEIVLWGRSMGAVAALIYASRGHPAISGLVLDSPYFSLSQLITQKASQITQIPSTLMTPLLYCIDSSLHQTANLSLENLDLTTYLSSARLTHLPTLLVASKNDVIIGCHHSEQLYREYPCSSKDILYIQQGHNTPRREETVRQILWKIREWTRGGKTSLTSLIGMSNRRASYKYSLSGRGITARTI